MSWLDAVHARGLRHLGRLDLDLRPRAEHGVKHLVLTGPNGSGKTVLLEAIVDELEAAIDGRKHPAVDALWKLGQTRGAELDVQLKLAHFSRPVRLGWSHSLDEIGTAFRTGRLIVAYVSAQREANFAAAAPPGPTDGDPKRPREKVGSRLSSLLASRRDELRVTTESRDRGGARRAEGWFTGVQAALGRLLHQPQLVLAHDRDGFHLDLPDGRRMHFDELSRGHAQAVGIWAEIMLRVEAARVRASDPTLQPDGIVCIDAPELDLDVRLQRELLAAITEMHPRLQLVIATHSPLMALRLDDALVFDLASSDGRPSADLRDAGIDAMLAGMLEAEPIAARPSVSPKGTSSIPPHARETLGLPPKPAPRPPSSAPPPGGVPRFTVPSAGLPADTQEDEALRWPPPVSPSFTTPTASGAPPAWGSDSLSSGAEAPPARTLAEAAAMAAERRVSTSPPSKPSKPPPATLPPKPAREKAPTDPPRRGTLTGAGPWGSDGDEK